MEDNQALSAMPLFDSTDLLLQGNPVVNSYITQLSLGKVADAGLLLEHATDWLYEQRDSENNYKAYRSELTTFFHWCFDVAGISAASVSRREMGRYVAYCQAPPTELVGYFNVPQFKTDKFNQSREPNPNWRPFIGRKALGKPLPYSLSDNALKTKIAILSSFYTYLMSEEYCERNPAQLWLNHSRFANKSKFRLDPAEEQLKVFSELQWSYLVACVQRLAEAEPAQHQRSLFLINLMYGCYLRISEIAARAGYAPTMSQFKRHNHSGIWYFHIPRSKGGKARNVAVSKALLQSLQSYRRHLGLSDYPQANETTPLFIRHRAAGRGRESGVLNANLGIRQLRDEIQFLINCAADDAEKDGFIQEANEMRQLTAHSIRHTGITHDINLNGRPLSHVQADAGHESIDTTSQYLHTSQEERHQSASAKPLDRLQGIES